jgi:hypothetical protein
MKVEPQLDGSALQSVDCGVASTVEALDHASGGKIVPTTEKVREKMDDHEGGTNPWDWQKGIDGFASRFKAVNLKPPRTLIVNGGSLDELREILFDKQRLVILALNYGVVANQVPRLWSSTSYRGPHAVAGRRGIERRGEDRVLTFDPLADGRRVGGKRMVHGPRGWPWKTIRDACRKLEVDRGNGLVPYFPHQDKWLGLVVWKAVPKNQPDPPDPTPDPPDPPTPNDALYELLDDMEMYLDQIEASMVSLRTLLPPDSDSLEEPKDGLRQP